MASTFLLQRGVDEFLLCRRAVDAGSVAVRFQERVAAVAFIRSCITNPVLEHKLRLWILSDPRPSMILDDQENLFEHIARRLLSGHMAIAKVDAEGNGKGILRQPGGANQKSKKNQKQEKTALQDEMERRANAMDEAEVVDLTQQETQPEPETTWIEIELLEPDGKPAAGERYKVTLPDGSVKWGHLDGMGKARIEKLQPGNCQVTFPDRDQEVWDVAQ